MNWHIKISKSCVVIYCREVWIRKKYENIRYLLTSSGINWDAFLFHFLLVLILQNRYMSKKSKLNSADLWYISHNVSWLGPMSAFFTSVAQVLFFVFFCNRVDLTYMSIILAPNYSELWDICKWSIAHRCCILLHSGVVTQEVGVWSDIVSGCGQWRRDILVVRCVEGHSLLQIWQTGHRL